MGDCVQLEGGFTPLLNDRFATKTADDRACVAILLRTMQRLQKMDSEADLCFVASCQEEITSLGAMTSAFGIDPDFAVVLDVTHARTPGAPELEAFKIDSPTIAKGPYLHPVLRKKLEDTAKALHVEYQEEIVPRYTWTDTDDIEIARGGVPSVLLSLPVRYMHTAVETFDMNALEECARLLAAFCADADDTWRDALWT